MRHTGNGATAESFGRWKVICEEACAVARAGNFITDGSAKKVRIKILDISCDGEITIKNNGIT